MQGILQTMLMMEQTILIQKLQRKINQNEKDQRKRSRKAIDFNNRVVPFESDNDEYDERLDTASTAESK